MSPLLEINPEIMGGEPVVKGTRITCDVLRGFYEGGMDASVLANLYNLSIEQVVAAVRFTE